MANDFSGDSDVIALYNFENGALVTDSKNSNTLTNNNSVAADTVNFKEGAASAAFNRATNTFLDITDTNLQSDFPLKSGTSNNVFSILGWFRTLDVTRQGIINKYETIGNRRSLFLRAEAQDLTIGMGYNSGASFESLYSGTVNVIANTVWYHYMLTFNNGVWRLRVWSDSTLTYVLTVNGTAVNNISLLDVPWVIGSYRPDDGGNSFDGNIDETVFFKRVVSDADQDSIIAGTYTSGPSPANIPVLSNSYKRRRAS